MKNRFIIITGPKHSGKSSTARALERTIGGLAVDLDELVEKQSGKTPRELYLEGPEIFRRAEALALASLISPAQELPMESDIAAQPEPLIIAAGGGLVDNDEAVALISKAKNLCVLYLEIQAETAWQRIAGKELPPFLNTENPKETHLALHKRRSESYRKMAHFTISAENRSPMELAAEISKRLKEAN